MMKKAWTILYYASGNNDLAPEMNHAFQTMQQMNLDNNINILIQISLANKQMVQILRPFEQLHYNCHHETPKRYLIQNKHTILVDKLNECNMADPQTLQDFISWGIKEYPAQHYMLILGGHGYQFVGTITDYGGKLPCIMGYPQMANAIELACNEQNANIDIVFLDTCYANFVETIYEFGKQDNTKIQYLITYVVNGALGGYPIETLLPYLQSDLETQTIVTNLVESNYDLVAFYLNNNTLDQLKNSFSKLADDITNNNDTSINLTSLFQKGKLSPYDDRIKTINELSDSIVIHPPRNELTLPLLNIANEPSIKTVASHYLSLSFSKDNTWTKLLLPNIQSIPAAQFTPTVLSPEVIYALISTMNKSADPIAKKRIFQALAFYKGWQIKN